MDGHAKGLENYRFIFRPTAWTTRVRCPSAWLVGPRRGKNTMSDIVLKYPNWQEPYRAAVIETNPKLLKQKIAVAEQVAKLRFKELENEKRVALTDVLSALKILEESDSL
jgi:hypothetical protein